MQQPRNLVPQTVPPDFADTLRRLRDTDDPRLNHVLAAARAVGWRTATLAGVLQIQPAACSKRIERASSSDPDTVARRALRAASRVLADNVELSTALAVQADGPNPRRQLAVLGQLIGAGPTTDAARQAARGLERAAQHRPPRRPDLKDITIPPASKPAPAMMNGRRLDPDLVTALRGQQAIAAKVNGAMRASHPHRRIGEEFTRTLAQLIDRDGYTLYYLAQELGVTHRAIASRLERHGYRPSCPSVAGTPSGTYYRRKVGDLKSGTPPVPDRPAFSQPERAQRTRPPRKTAPPVLFQAATGS